MRHSSRYALLLIASTLFVLACDQAEESSDQDYHRGRNALSMARYDWARSYFQADLEQNPGRLESQRSLGIGWISGYQGSLTQAIEAFERYLEQAPEDASIRLRLARARLQGGDSSGALEALDSLGMSGPVRSDELEARLLRVRAEMEADPRRAWDLLQSSLEGFPEHAEVRNLAAKVQSRLGNDEAALEHLERAAAVDPLNGDFFYRMGQKLRRLGREEEAAKALEVYEILHQMPGPGRAPSPQVELELLQQLEKVLRPRPALFQRRLARALLESGRTAEALPVLDGLREQADGFADPDAWLLLAQAAHLQGALSVARDLYQDVLDHHPDHLKALAQQGQLACDADDCEAGADLLARAFEQDTHYAPLHFTAGLLALQRGEDDEALQSLGTAVDLVPWLPRYRLTLADVLLTRGDREAVERLLAEAPQDPALEAYAKRHALEVLDAAP